MRTKQLKTCQRFELLDRQHGLIMDEEDAVRAERERVKADVATLVELVPMSQQSRATLRRGVSQI